MVTFDSASALKVMVCTGRLLCKLEIAEILGRTDIKSLVFFHFLYEINLIQSFFFILTILNYIMKQYSKLFHPGK